MFIKKSSTQSALDSLVKYISVIKTSVFLLYIECRTFTVFTVVGELHTVSTDITQRAEYLLDLAKKAKKMARNINIHNADILFEGI